MDTRDILKVAATTHALMNMPPLDYSTARYRDAPSKPKRPTNRDKIKAARKQRRKSKRK